ncbi:MAG TPA: SH3 domain-containing protein [Leptolyngbyaceae cyanobacterium]
MKRYFEVAALSLIFASSLALTSCNRSKEAEIITPAPTTDGTSAPATQTQPISPSQNSQTPPVTTPPTQSQADPISTTAINPPKSATLVAQDAAAQINLRSQPNAQSKSKGYGLVGDGVKLLQAAEGGDQLTWYYVRFNQSGAEGWIRGDFIDTSGRVQAAGQTTNNSSISQCEGVFEDTVFIARYGNGSFTRIEFRNLESKATFAGNLRPQGSNSQGQPVFVGEVTPPAGGSYSAQITDLSGGNPKVGSQVALDYDGIPATGTCK